MNHLTVKNEVSASDGILVSEVIEDFIQVKNSHQTRRSYLNDLTGFFKTLDGVVFLSDFGLIPYPQVVTQVQNLTRRCD